MVLIFCCLIVSAQNEAAVFMRWKIKPGETVVYKTIMDEIDSSNYKGFSFGGMQKLAGKDSSSWSNQMQQILKDVDKKMQNSHYLTYLTHGKARDVIVEMKTAEDNTDKASGDTAKPRTDYDRFKALTKQMMTGVMLRGVVNEDGAIESFYLKNEQKNLVALLFQLPGKQVKVGDSWPIDVHFISMDQHFICDTSFYKNRVTVLDIKNINKDQVVTLKYELAEYVSGNFSGAPAPLFGKDPVKTLMSFSYNGVADFSITNGRWINYNGVMSLSSTGVMSAQQTKRFALIPQ